MSLRFKKIWASCNVPRPTMDIHLMRWRLHQSLGSAHGEIQLKMKRGSQAPQTCDSHELVQGLQLQDVG